MQILVADDEPLMRLFLRDALKRFSVFLAQDGEEAIALLSLHHFDLIITDMKMPKKSGIDVLEAAKKIDPSVIVIIITAFATIENAVEAMNRGAFNYLLKPFSVEAIEALLEKAKQHEALVKENQYLKEEISVRQNSIIAESPFMKQLLIDLEKVAKSNASVFISGESGTGKEVIAKAIHEASPRSKKPFIKINCAAIPESLVESEFFGHERGSFTGAESRKLGRFELANEGTLLLDEITEIPLTLQPKLLRAIQEQEFERVGGIKVVSINVRFIATSNRNMKEVIDNKSFREDLFYRLNVIPINIIPLRERKEDLLPLTDYFLKRFCFENHKPLKVLSQNCKSKLLDYHWPGNIRELANVIERMVVLDKEPSLEEKELSGSSLADIERRAILETLKNYSQNKTKAAKALGISIRTLRNKLSSYKQ